MSIYYGGDDISAVVVDIGGGTTKVGYAGEEQPKRVFPTVIAPNHRVGDDIPKESQVEDMKRPFLQGFSEDSQDIEQILQYGLFEKGLQLDANEMGPLLLSESLEETKKSKEVKMEVCFETFKVPAYYNVKDAVLSAFSFGKPTAIIVELGYRNTRFVPVFEGYALKQVSKTLNAGLKDIVQQMDPLYGTSLTMLPSYHRHLLYHDIMMTHYDFYGSTSFGGELWYEVNADVRVQLKEEARLVGKQYLGGTPGTGGFISEGLQHIIENCDSDIRRELSNNILVVGGGIVCPGVQRRVEEQVRRNYTRDPKSFMQPIAMRDKRYSTWVGGSILASLGSFHQSWISQAEYAESGPSIVHRKD